MGTRVPWKSRDEEGPHSLKRCLARAQNHGPQKRAGEAHRRYTDPVTRKQRTGMPTSSGTGLGTEAMSTNGNRGVRSGRGALMCPS